MSKKYVGKPIGARKLTWFPLIEDPEIGAATYGAPVKLSRLINITITPILSEAMLESDDGVEDDISMLVGYDVAINASQLTDGIRASLLGHTIDESGGLLAARTDIATEGALAWEEQLSSDSSGPAKYKKTVLYRGKFKEFAKTANTIVQNGVTYQTNNLTGRFLSRNDGNIEYSMRGDTPGADAGKMAAWFDVPQEKGGAFMTTVEAPTATPAAGAVAADTLVALESGTVDAMIRYTLDGSEPHAGSTAYDGPIKMTKAMTIKAKAYKAGMNASPALEAEYTIT